MIPAELQDTLPGKDPLFLLLLRQIRFTPSSGESQEEIGEIASFRGLDMLDRIDQYLRHWEVAPGSLLMPCLTHLEA